MTRNAKITVGSAVALLLCTLLFLLSPGPMKLLAKKEEAKQTKAIHDIGEISKVIQLFYLEKDRLPEFPDEIADQSEREEVPLDPWGNAYVYEQKGENDFDIISLGADGKEGGEGFDRDLNRRTFRPRPQSAPTSSGR